MLPVDRDGVVDPEIAEPQIDDHTLLVSVQAANNEIGTIQAVTDLARLAHARGAFFHCDAAQAVGKIHVDVQSWGVDLMSISAHKMYGPKGVGALYVANDVLSSQLVALFAGGGQERGLRPGTLNVPAIVGLGEACQISQSSLTDEAVRVGRMRDVLESKLLSSVDGLRRNGALWRRLPGNSSLTFAGIDAEALIANVPTVAVSVGSACNSGAPEPSYVLLAIGLSREEAYSTLRIGLGRFTTPEGIESACGDIIRAAGRISRLAAKN
jgi:cysteine desulfurase